MALSYNKNKIRLKEKAIYQKYVSKGDLMKSALSSKKMMLSLLVTPLFLLSHPAAATTHMVEIKRDHYGVPHIFADNHYALFYGYGYAVAQDRLFQMDMARRSFTGTVAEVLGPGENDTYLKYDINIRQNFSPDSIRSQIAALNKEEADIFKGYADGFNAYLKKVKRNPELLPKEYIDYGFQPKELTDFDVVMIWVGSMANRFSDVNLEINALALLQDLEKQHGKEKAQRIFNELRWINDPKSPTTVPATPQYSYKTVSQEPLPQLAPLSAAAFKDTKNRQIANWGGTGPDFAPKASNLWITQAHRTQENATILINGPQFGWYNPSYTYGIGLHGAGFNVVGNTPFAYPVILFGTNNEIAWGATAGPQDVVDIYQLQLNPNRSDQYWFNGQYISLESHEETIKVKGHPDTTITVWKSKHHGLITQWDKENHIAYSKKRSWTGYEVQSLVAWLNVARAKNWNDFLKQAEKMAITINWYYADKNGNIGYVSPGYLPKRPAHQDIRLPAKGDGSMEWEGILGFDAIPKTYNPSQGYISNWNNRPSPDKTNTDAYYWTYGDRVNELNSQYETKDQFSLKEIWDFNKKASYIDVNWRYFHPHLTEANKNLIENSPVQQMTQTLLNWNGLEHDHEGYNSTPARLIFKTWLEEMYQLVLAPIIPPSHHAAYLNTGFAPETGPSPGSINLSMGTKVLLRALDLEKNPDPSRYSFFKNKKSSDIIKTALHNTHQRLSSQYGPNFQEWKIPTSIHYFNDHNFAGIPQTSLGNTYQFSGYQNRGTENNRIIFSESGVEFCDVTPPGQSGFIDRHGNRSQHYDDQMKLYQNFECKKVETPIDGDLNLIKEHTTILVKKPNN